MVDLDSKEKHMGICIYILYVYIHIDIICIYIDIQFPKSFLSSPSHLKPGTAGRGELPDHKANPRQLPEAED